MGSIAEVDLASIVCKVGQDDAEIDEAGEDAGAETSDTGRSDLGDVHRSYHNGLADTEARDEAPSVDNAEVAIRAQEEGNSDDPHKTQLTGGPDAANTVADNKGAVIEEDG